MHSTPGRPAHSNGNLASATLQLLRELHENYLLYVSITVISQVLVYTAEWTEVQREVKEIGQVSEWH